MLSRDNQTSDGHSVTEDVTSIFLFVISTKHTSRELLLMEIQFAG